MNELKRMKLKEVHKDMERYLKIIVFIGKNAQ